MRYPAKETAEKHQRILKEASRMFRERGFEGVNVAQIMQAAGLTHGTFYAHFDSKEVLAREAIKNAMEGTIGTVDQALRSDEPKMAFMDGYLSRKHRDASGHGCAIAALSVEIGRGSNGMRAAYSGQLRRMLDKMAAGFGWKTHRSSRREAIACLSTIVGAVIIARSVDDKKLSDEFLNAVRTTYSLAEL